MSPNVVEEGGFIFYFYVPDLALGEPIHVHVRKGKRPTGRDAKIWIDSFEVARRGAFSEKELRDAVRIAKANESTIRKEWHVYKSRYTG